ncbi:hypothetical protein ABFB09_02490 [Dehalogenimonas sp. THU2]|uniref:hypothetical protein n=1 Tax=Dehalogenimonas sp. THU2 TaxID=3151121 RepID=UPI0032181A0A
MKILGVLLTIAGFIVLFSIVAEAEFMSWATGDMFSSIIASLVGLAMIHAGWRLLQTKPKS